MLAHFARKGNQPTEAAVMVLPKFIHQEMWAACGGALFVPRAVLGSQAMGTLSAHLCLGEPQPRPEILLMSVCLCPFSLPNVALLLETG